MVSVENPDRHVFGPPGSGPISQRYGSRSETGSETFVLDPQHCFEEWFTCTSVPDPDPYDPYVFEPLESAS
jgi:hypothetical protein